MSDFITSEADFLEVTQIRRRLQWLVVAVSGAVERVAPLAAAAHVLQRDGHAAVTLLRALDQAVRGDAHIHLRPDRISATHRAEVGAAVNYRSRITARTQMQIQDKGELGLAPRVICAWVGAEVTICEVQVTQMRKQGYCAIIFALGGALL